MLRLYDRTIIKVIICIPEQFDFAPVYMFSTPSFNSDSASTNLRLKVFFLNFTCNRGFVVQGYCCNRGKRQPPWTDTSQNVAKCFHMEARIDVH